MSSPLAGIEQPGRHEPGRRKCAGCPKMAAVRRMVRGPDGQLYGSSCARKRGLIGAPAGRGRGGHPIDPRGATTAPATLFDQPKEQPAMLPAPTTEPNVDPATLTTARRFVVERFQDPTGASATGIVLDGILWPDGTVSVRWRGDADDQSFVSWPSMGAVERKHCYGGLSRVVWVDPDPDTDVVDRPGGEQHVLVLTALEERASLLSGELHTRDLQGLAGRRRILERHAPVAIDPDRPPLCDNVNHVKHGMTWPCADYRDAAAGLVSGLETP